MCEGHHCPSHGLSDHQNKERQEIEIPQDRILEKGKGKA